MSDELYSTWGSDQERADVYSNSKDLLQAYGGVQKSVAYRDRTYIDVQPGRSVRPSFTKYDYNAFRPTEQVPQRQKRIIKMCMDAYDRVGIIRNVIDLMGDFSSQGITLVHPNKTIEKFYRAWFNQINGVERSERFLNYLYRSGNVIVRRKTAKINKTKENELKKAAAADINPELVKISKREIPWQYEFLNPIAVDYKQIAVGKFQLVMNLTNSTYQGLMNNSNKTVISEDLRRKLENGERQIPLDTNSVKVFSYKKDDWLLWANPMIYAILDDIMMLEKMKLADLAALDGAISNIRLWTVGDLEHKIAPKKAIIDKLRDILASNVGGGTMDLVWGPELKFQESNSQIYRFLGSEKYQPVLTSIYAGLGIPPTLTGIAGSSGGYSNNYVSLKTLIERLEYGRTILSQFWMEEIEIVQRAMGFKTPAKIHYDTIVLSDEAAMKNLMVQLADRDIISQETLLERFGELSEIEKVRIKREEKARNRDPEMPRKASPYHNPNHKSDIVKLAVNNGVLDAETYFEDIGLPYNKKNMVYSPPPAVAPGPSGSAAPQAGKPKKTSNPAGGRPLLSQDKTKRTTKRVLPKSGEAAALWALGAQKSISSFVNTIGLNHFNKKDVRSLTKQELAHLENLKLSILTSLKPLEQVNAESIKLAIERNKKPSKEFMSLVEKTKKEFTSSSHATPTVEDLRYIYAISYANFC
jgi:hypothetical protein